MIMPYFTGMLLERAEGYIFFTLAFPIKYIVEYLFICLWLPFWDHHHSYDYPLTK